MATPASTFERGSTFRTNNCSLLSFKTAKMGLRIRQTKARRKPYKPPTNVKLNFATIIIGPQLCNRVFLPENLEYGVYGDLIVIYPKPYSIYSRGTITPLKPAPHLTLCRLNARPMRCPKFRSPSHRLANHYRGHIGVVTGGYKGLASRV